MDILSRKKSRIGYVVGESLLDEHRYDRDSVTQGIFDFIADRSQTLSPNMDCRDQDLADAVFDALEDIEQDFVLDNEPKVTHKLCKMAYVQGLQESLKAPAKVEARTRY